MPGDAIEVLSIESGSICKTTASGTSQAAAITSGYIALIKDYYVKTGTPISNGDLLLRLSDLATQSNNTGIDYTLPFMLS